MRYINTRLLLLLLLLLLRNIVFLRPEPPLHQVALATRHGGVYVQQLKNRIFVGGRSSLEAGHEPAGVARPVDQRVGRVAVRTNRRQSHGAVLVRLLPRLTDHRRAAVHRPLRSNNTTIRVTQ